MRFTIHGPIKPFVHRTYQGKYSERAQAYHASQNAIAAKLKNQMQLNGWRFILRGTPLRLRLHITRPAIHRVDATNLQKAVEDAAQGIVFENDAWVDDIHTTVEAGKVHVAVLDVEPMLD